MKGKNVLFKIEIVLIILTFLSCIILITCTSILPHQGIHFMWNSKGDSMLPTIKDSALVIWRDDVNLNDIAIDDIIIFKTPKGWYTSSQSQTLQIKKGTIDSDSNTATDASIIAETPDPEINTPTGYMDDQHIVHRVVEISSDGTLITKGDNNPETDKFAITAEGLVGKAVWYKNGIGLLFQVMYDDFGLLWLVGATVILGAVLFILSRRKGFKHKKDDFPWLVNMRVRFVTSSTASRLTWESSGNGL